MTDVLLNYNVGWTKFFSMVKTSPLCRREMAVLISTINCVLEYMESSMVRVIDLESCF